jgi:uncharacterized protein (TIGR02679 family)
VLRDERLDSLWQVIHQRLEASGGQLSGVTAHLRQPTGEQRAAVDRLLGIRSRGVDLHVPLHQLDDLLRQRLGTSLLEVVTAAVGPVRDNPGERAALAESESAMWSRLEGHQTIRRHPTLDGWLERMSTTGTWRRLDEPERRLTEALDVLAHMPQPVRCGRSRLAAQTLGDAHSLDDSAPTGRLVTAALAHLAGEAGPRRAADRRKLWSDQGVVSDETSSTVLTVGLRPRVAGPLTEASARWADGATPLPIPLAAVQTEEWRVEPGTQIWVCENPAIVAAAAHHAASVICLEGRPSLAAGLLLRSLIGGGAKVAYHGDFGTGGISIANEIIGGMGAAPWRFGLEDYEMARNRASTAGIDLRQLRGTVPDACWDPQLAPAVRAGGVEVEEELVLDLLLGDLGGAQPEGG